MFEFGGIILAIMLLSHIRKIRADHAFIDLKLFRKAVILLFPFSILGVISFTRLFDWAMGLPAMQLLNNFATGVLFVWFLVLLKQSIRKDEPTQNKSVHSDG